MVLPPQWNSGRIKPLLVIRTTLLLIAHTEAAFGNWIQEADWIWLTDWGSIKKVGCNYQTSYLKSLQ